MLKTQENNKEVLELVNAKVQIDYNKLYAKFSKKSEDSKKEEQLDTITWGTKANEKLIYGSVAVPVAPLAVGAVSTTLGLVTLVPSLLEQPVVDEANQVIMQMKGFSSDAIEFGLGAIGSSIPLILVPAAVSAISISTKIYRELQRKKKTEMQFSKEVIQLIDDIVEKKEDPTLEFANTFLKRVDLSGNDQKVNLELLRYITNYRMTLQYREQNMVDDERVQETFDYIVKYIEKMLFMKNGVSEEFKNNRFVNILVDEYRQKEYEKEILGEGKSR